MERKKQNQSKKKRKSLTVADLQQVSGGLPTQKEVVKAIVFPVELVWKF
jgi:hypothetical protein